MDRLRSALEDGRLTMDEYVNRMEAAYKAATYGALSPLCADLPASTPVVAGTQTAAGGTAPPAVFSPAGYLAGLPTVLKIPAQPTAGRARAYARLMNANG